MARISLRGYIRDVESLIEKGQHDQAIAHCRHILQYFPKYIDTYRLLGKAFLENQRYGDAADIFQRVLSSVPDDFISHVGMSIIREDEGNLDASIYHMERAFEIQPANAAIQNELRRLYGKRDRFEPPKVRLTRGALARMYVKGELYAQAITELRAALAEEPQRIDLQLSLAKAYHRSNQPAEAAGLCNAVLNKLPYCLEANQILGEILMNSDRAPEARAYHQQVQALNPYFAHISPHAQTADKVPDEAITVHKLELKPGQAPAGASSQPQWVSSLGVSVEGLEAGQEALPDWLKDASQQAITDESEGLEKVSPFGPPLARGPETGEGVGVGDSKLFPETSEPDKIIPDWMKEAGWSPASDQSQGSGSVFDLDESDEQAEQLAPAEIPDWLQAIAPALESPETPAETPPLDSLNVEIESDALSWLEETPSGATDSDISWLEDKTPVESTQEDLPEAPYGSISPAEKSLADEEIPDWLKDLGEEDISSAIEPEQIPDWLKELSPESQPETTPEIAEQDVSEAQAGELPGWLEELAQPEMPDQSILAAPPLGEQPASEWLAEIAPTEELPVLEVPELEPQEEQPDWLRELEPDELTPGETPEGEPEPYTWTDEQPSETAAEEPGELVSGDEAGLPDWLREVEAGEPASLEGVDLVEQAPKDAELPDWLKDIEAQGAPSETEPAEWLPQDVPVQEEPAALEPSGLVGDVQTEDVKAGQPEWLAEEEIAAEELTEGVAEVSEAGPEIEPAGFTEISQADEDAAFAWLEGLAARQGAEEAMLLSPEQHLDEPPDWVKQAAETIEVEGEALEGIAGVEEPVETAGLFEAAPDLAEISEAELSDVEAGEAETSLPEETAGEDDLRKWLAELETSDENLVAETPPAVEVQPEISGAVELPDWLEGLEENLGEPEVDRLEPVGLEEPPIIEGDTKPTRIQPPEEIAAPAVEAPSEQLSDMLPDWVKTPVIESEIQPEIEPSEPEPAAIEMAALGQVTSESLTEETPPEATPAEAMDEDAAFAWLESLAVRQGADEALLLKPEERLDEPPEWVQQAVEEAAEAQEQVSIESEAELEPSVIDEMPDALEQEIFVEEPLAPEQPAEPLEDLLPAAPEMMETPFVEEEVSISDYPDIPVITDVTEEVTPALEEEAAEVPELPDWLADIEKEVEEEAPWSPPAEATIEPEVMVPAQELQPEEIEEVIQVFEQAPASEFLAEQDSLEPQVTLVQARNAMIQDKLEQAIEKYTELINSGQLLPEISQDLVEALYRYPLDITIWQALGDTHLRANKLQEALNAYTKAEELIR